MKTHLEREQQLHAWINQYTDFECQSLEIVSGDASFRRYFRFDCQGQSIIAVDAPPAHENARQFIAVAKRYGDQGVRVPTVYASNLEQGFYLQQDFGDTLFSDALTPENCAGLYQKALTNIPLIQACITTKEGPLPDFDEAFIDIELQLFTEWLLDKYLGLSPTKAETQMLNQTFKAIKQQCLSQPLVGMHRDYHSRNLMITESGEVAVIDFQDAVVGPITYDAVSLLRDSYQKWPEELIDQWLRDWHKRFYAKYSWPEFKMWFDCMGMQRHIKIAGIFARLAIRDNKPHYLQDIPRTLEYLMYELSLYPEFSDMAKWIKLRILPAVLKTLDNTI